MGAVQLDWRPILPRIRVPCLNLIGRQSAVFPWQGTEVVGRLVQTCRTVRALWCLYWQPAVVHRSLLFLWSLSCTLAAGRCRHAAFLAP